MVFRDFLGDSFFLVRPPPAGNSDLVLFWPVLGRGHLEKSWTRAGNIKTQFPGARGPKTERKRYHAVRDGCPQPFYVLRFARPDSHGREIAQYGHFRPFWPRTAFGTWRNRARAENGKTQFPGARGPEIEGKSYHAIRDGCPQLFYPLRFARPDPQGQEIAKHGYVRPFWPRTALGTWRNPGAGPKTEKRNFPVLGALLGKYTDAPKVSPRKCATFLLFTFWPTGPPRAENCRMPPPSHQEVETHPFQLGPNTRS